MATESYVYTDYPQMQEYFYQEYPKMLFNPNGQIMVVHSREEQQAAGKDWHESPAEYGVETCPAATAAVEGGFYGVGYAAPQTVKPPEQAPREAQQSVAALEDEAARTRRGRGL